VSDATPPDFSITWQNLTSSGALFHLSFIGDNLVLSNIVPES